MRTPIVLALTVVLPAAAGASSSEDAFACSLSYALGFAENSSEGAEVIAESAFRRCFDLWQLAAEEVDAASCAEANRLLPEGASLPPTYPDGAEWRAAVVPILIDKIMDRQMNRQQRPQPAPPVHRY